MKTEKKIEQCEKLLAELKDELLNKPEFKKNDWVSVDGFDKPLRISEVNEPWFTINNSIAEIHLTLIERLATESEIKSHLIEEAERRGYKEGVKIKSLKDGCRRSMRGSYVSYDYENDDLYLGACHNGNTLVYREGEWAEIIKNTVKLNDEYEAEIFDDHIKVGCQTFSKDVIKKLYEAIK